MFYIRDSPIYRSGKLLCDDFSRSAQTVNCSLGSLSDSQHLESNSVDERILWPSPNSIPPILAPDTDFQMFHSMYPIVTGYYSTPLPACTSHSPQYAGYSTADGRLVTDIYDPPFDSAMDFREMLLDPQVAPQPPTPPPAAESSASPNPGFFYHPCRWLSGPQCDGFAPGKNREMAEHLRVYHQFIGHERDVVSCEWENCGQSMQRMNVARHIVSRHLLAVARCRLCSKPFCRPDVVARHERTCIGAPSV